MPNTAAAVAMLEALDPTPAVEAPAAEAAEPAAEAPAVVESVITDSAVQSPTAEKIAEAATPAGPSPAEVEARARQARLDDQLRALRGKRNSKREEAAQKRALERERLAAEREKLTHDNTVANELASIRKNPIEYMRQNGQNAAELLRDLADAARKEGTPEAQIEQFKIAVRADIDAAKQEAEAAKKEVAELRQREQEREKQTQAQRQQAQFAAIKQQENEQMFGVISKGNYPFTKAYFDDANDMVNTMRTIGENLVGQRGGPVPMDEIASVLEQRAKAHALATHSKLAPLLQGSGAVKLDPKAASAPKGKGATTLSNEISSTRASNRTGRRVALEERQREAARMLAALDSPTK